VAKRERGGGRVLKGAGDRQGSPLRRAGTATPRAGCRKFRWEWLSIAKLGECGAPIASYPFSQRMLPVALIAEVRNS
jgi:hypothetical protein